MLFNSAHFLFFFPAVLALFFLSPKRLQWAVLLMASAYFYMAFVPWYILVLLGLIVTDYILGRAIAGSTGGARKALLVVSVLANGGTLFLFKYFNFFGANITALAALIGWNYSAEALSWVLPIGLSFHVFQSLSYVIEVYRGRQEPEKHLGIYALYVLFFPQLVAGPIERPQNLLNQFREPKRFEWERAKDGLTLMLWGFFKKLVIADQLAVVVDTVYGDINGMPPAALLLAALMFSYQIYCDFSGYTDIARGAARVMGFELMRNFDRPYAARTVTEFWHRWHISLSSWIRDYMFTPLAVRWRRSGKVGVALAVFVAFFFSGLWHGAAWTFVVWGLCSGVAILLETTTATWRRRVDTAVPRLSAFFGTLYVFVFWSTSLVFFRAPSISEAWNIIQLLPRGFLQLFDVSFMREEVLVASTLGVGAAFVALRLAAIVSMEFVEYMSAREHSLRSLLLRYPFAHRLSAYYVVAIWVFLLGNLGARTFIYFQF